MKGGYNIVQLLDIIRDPASKTPSLVLEYNENIDHKILYKTFTDFDVRYYMYELLKVGKIFLIFRHWIIHIQGVSCTEMLNLTIL